MLPQYLYEHILARHYGWNKAEIDALSYYDMQCHLHICLVRESIDMEWQAQLAGASPKGSNLPSGGKSTITKKFDPVKGDFV
mgnify:FL=1